MKTLNAFLSINKNWICNGLILFLLFFYVSSTHAQIAQRGTATTATAAANTVAVNKPTGVVAGDIMFANVVGYLNGTTTAATGPAGWTTIGATAIDRGFATLLYRIADATDTGVTSYTFTTTTGSNPSNAAIVAFSGVDALAPFEGTQPTVWSTATAASINTLTSITTVNPGAALVQFASAARITSTTNTNFTSWLLSAAELYDFGNNAANTAAIGAAWVTRPTAGLTGAGGFTCTPNTASRTMGGIMITLSPALQFRSLTSGAWSSPSTWQQSSDGGTTWTNAVSVPTAGDVSATIRNGHIVTLSAAASSPALTIDAGGTLTPGANLLTLNSDFVNNGTLTSGSGGITIAGDDAAQSIDGFTTTGTVSMIKTTGTATFAGNVNGAGLTMNGNGGTLNLGIGLTHTFTGAWTRSNGTLQGGSSILKIGGSISGTTGTFTAGTGTVEYNGAAQTAAVVTYNNLTLSGSLAKTFATTPTISGVLSIEGTATVTVTTGVVTYGSGATLQFNNRGTYTSSAEECTLTATTNLVLLGTSTITLPANQTLNSLTVSSGAILTLAAIQLTINGGLTNNGTINVTTGRLNQVAGSTGDFANTGSIVFTGAGQVAFARNFTNSGTFTLLSTPITILGTATQSIDGFTTTGDVSMTKTAGVATFAGNVNGAGLTMNGNGGTLNLGTGLTHTFTGAWTRTNGTLQGGSSILKIGGSVSGATGTFTAGTGTVEYNGAAQTAAVVTYNNLTLSGSLAKTFATTPTVNGILSLEGTATVTVTTGVVTYGTGATLQYNNRGTYTGTTAECTLTATTNLVLLGTSTITLPANQTLNSLTVNLGSTLTLAAIQLTINGGVTNGGSINVTTGRLNQVTTATGDFANTGSIVFTGAGQVAFARNFTNSGTFTLSSTPVTIVGANTQSIAGFTTTGDVSMTKTAGTATFGSNVNGAGLTINGLGGTLNLGTGLTHTFTGAWTRTNGTLEGGSSVLKIGGSVSGTTGTFTAGTGTVEYNGAAQTAAAVTYNNLILSGSGIKTITGLATINGNFTMNGNNTTTASTTVPLSVGGNLTVGVGNTLTLGNNNPALTLTGSASISGTVTSPGAGKTIGGNFTINSGGSWTEAGGPAYSFSGNFTNDGTFSAGTSTATFSGTTQSIGGASATTFNNLTLATNASTKTFGRVINVSGALTINTGVQANLGTFAHTAASLLLAGVAQGTGTSWGGTGSPANNLNTTFFTAATGVVNVLCNLSYSLTSTTVASPVCSAGASVTLAHTTTTNLPAGTYRVYYTLSGATTGSFNTLMTTATAGSGTFTTGALSAGSTTITIDYLRNGCVSNIISGNTATFTVNPDLPASVSITASPSTTICSGTNVTFTATPTNGGTPSYQWKLNGVNVGSNSATYTNSALANNDVVTVVMTSTATCASGSPATSNGITMTVNPNLPASVSIAASPSTTICSGTNVTFTATPTNGGTPSYQWKLNGVNVGSNSATYSNSALVNSDAVSVIMTSTATCATGSPATSNTVNMTVNPNLPASVSIAASPSTTICSGTNVTFTATPTNGGTPSYQWKLNGVNVGSNSATYSNSALVNSDAVSVIMTSTATCATGSPATSNTVNMTVNPNLPASVSIAASPSTTICSGTNVTFTATPTNGGTPSYQWKLNGVNVGSNSATYSNNALANGAAVSVVMTSTATCATGSPATSNTVNMTVNTGSTAAVISGTSTICSGSANLKVAITGGTSPYTVVYSNGTSNFTVNNYVSGANISVAPTTTTTYSLVSVTSAQGCVGTGNSGSALITVGNCVTWNGSAWINGTPTSTSNLIFQGNYTIPSNLTAYSIVVNSGVVTIPSGYNVTLAGPITVNGGSFVVESNANLIQTNDVVNSGNIVVKRNTSMLKRQDYVLWSAPLVGQQLQSFSPETLSNRFYTYDSLTNLYTVVSAPSTTNFNVATGYLIRMPNNHPTTPTIWTGTFTGVPNNGTVTVGSLTGNKYYAVGNPYPSTISADDFIIANNLTDALYFWRKTNGALTSAYATYTLAGGTGNGQGSGSEHIPGGIIQVGQGFIAKTPASSSSLTFTNSMRRANNGNQFFRTTENRSRIWLDMTNNADYFGQTMIAYMPNATLGIDAGIDGRYMNDFGTALTSLIDSEEYAIQGRPLPFETSDVVPLGFKSLEATTFTISLSQVDGLFETQGINVFLKDNLTNTVHNLTESPYSFATEVGTFNNRFEIVYQESLMGVTPISFNESQVLIYTTPTNEIVINSGGSVMSTIKIFDMQGRLLLEKKNVNSNKSICNIQSSTEVLLVQIVSTDGIMVKKKVLFPKTALKFNVKIDKNFQMAADDE